MNQKALFSKISKAATAAWVVWTLIVLSVIWPARDKTELPTIDDTHASYVVSGRQEQLSANGSYQTSFSIEFDNNRHNEMLEHIAIKAGTFHKSVQLVSATLSSTSGACKGERPEKVDSMLGPIADLSYLQIPLDSLKNCLSEEQSLNGASFTLTLVTTSPIVFIGNSKPIDLVENPKPFVLSENGNKQFLDARFKLRSNSAAGWKERLAWPRFRLMAAVWGAEQAHTTMAFFGLLLLGASLLSWSMCRIIGAVARPGGKKAYACAVALAFLGASLLTSLIAPPFQAADEADHFRTFLLTTGLQQRDEEALKLAQRGHYDRLMCHRDQRLSVANLDCAMINGWPDHAGLTDGPARSMVADAVWRSFAKIFPLRDLNIALIHWGIRFFNGLFAALAVFLALSVFTNTYRASDIEDDDVQKHVLSEAAGAISILAIPTLTHFANHNSNHTFLIAAYIVLAISALKVLDSSILNWRMILLLGVSTTLGVFAGRAGVLLWLVTFGLFSLRWLTQNTDGRIVPDFKRETVSSIAIFIPTLIIGAIFKDHPYVQARLLPLFQTHLAAGLVGLTSLILLIPSLLLLVNKQSRQLAIQLKGHSFQAPWARKIPWTTVSIIIFALYLVSALIKTPTPIPNIEFSPPISATTYVWLVLKSFIRNSAPGGDDFLLIGSFWGGFGCPVDALHWFPLWIIQSFLMGGWIFGLLRVPRGGFLSERIRFLGFGLLCFTYLALLSYAVHSGPSTMHGRYMVGFYLLFIVGSLWGWFRWLHKQNMVSIEKYFHYLRISAILFCVTGIFSLILQFF